jgi:hypothetical protein
VAVRVSQATSSAPAFPGPVPAFPGPVGPGGYGSGRAGPGGPPAGPGAFGAATGRGAYSGAAVPATSGGLPAVGAPTL